MKKQIVKTVAVVLTVLLSVLSAFGLSTVESKAMTGSVSLTPAKTVLNIGDTIQVNFVITASPAAILEAEIAVSGSLQLVNATCGQADCANGKIARVAGNTGYYNGVITVKAVSAGNGTVALNKVRLVDETNPLEKTTTGGSCSVYVRTGQETQESQAVEASVQASIAASQAAHNASVAASKAAEQSRIESLQAIEASKNAIAEASKNSSIAESASIEESVKESSYIEESKKESIAESIAESKSVEEYTRPTEIETVKFAIGEWKDGKFYFAVNANDVKIPTGYKKAKLTVRNNDVLALKKDGMDKDTYLVYGMFKESEEPLWYYYHESSHEFFPFSYLNSDASYSDNEYIGTENEAGDPGNGRSFSNTDLILLIGFSVVIGALLAGLTVIIVRRRRQYED